MITNRMLLTKSNIEEEIPYKPFTDQEEIHWYLNDTYIQLIVGDTTGTSHTFSPISGNKTNDKGTLYIPKNHCTIEFGISNKEYEDITNINVPIIEGLLQISPISYNENGTEELSDVIDLSINTSNTFEIKEYSRRVQLDFEDNNELNFTLHLHSNPVISNISENKYGYINCYIKTSNAIHEQGPDLKEDGTPWIIKIAKYQ